MCERGRELRVTRVTVFRDAPTQTLYSTGTFLAMLRFQLVPSA